MKSRIERVFPTAYLIGQTTLDLDQLTKYLEDTDAKPFVREVEEARFSGVSDMEIICSVYAKLCYKSFVVGTNKNITRTRSIKDNIKGCFDVKHGSIFEHVFFNSIIRDCSRIFTHELVRHRVGTAFSQNSGRYIREDVIRVVLSPDIEHSKKIDAILENICAGYDELDYELDIDSTIRFDEKKKLTSSIRRILPNMCANDIGFTVNVRELRHILLMRTSRHAEWEMRYVFDKIYKLLLPKYGAFFHGLHVGSHEGYVEITEEPYV